MQSMMNLPSYVQSTTYIQSMGHMANSGLVPPSWTPSNLRLISRKDLITCMISEIITWDTHLHYSTQRSHVSQAKGIKCSRFPATSTLPANFKRRQEIEFIEKCSCDNFCFRFESAAHFRYIIFVFGSSQPPTFGTQQFANFLEILVKKN